jgi:hypothetical protein
MKKVFASAQYRNSAQAQVIADCCNTILDNKEAIAEGAVKGVVGIGQYMYEHPVETAMTVYAPGVMIPYRATKMTLF